MKKTILLIAFLTSTFYLFSQDVIIRTDGNRINCKITKIDSTSIYFDMEGRNGVTVSTSLNKREIQNYNQLVSGFMEVKDQDKGQKKDNDFTTKVGIFFNPLGFIQFGPTLGMEIVCTRNFIIEGHVRFSSAGLLMYAVSKNDNGDTPNSISGTGIGGGCQFFIPGRLGGLYVGSMIELGSQTSLFYQDNDWDKYQADTKYTAFMFNVGYKFTYQSGFFIKTGGFIGFGDVYYDKWHNTGTNTDLSVHEGHTKIVPEGFAELTFGVDF